MTRESWINLLVLVALPLAALAAHANGENYVINLLSRMAILGLAGVGLNFALGYGGMVSFGHAAFFGLGAYVAGIAAFHAFDDSLFAAIPFEIGGTNQMPTIWLLTALIVAVIAFLIGYISLRTSGVYFIMITLAFAQMLYYFAISWPTYGGEDGLSIYLRNEFPVVPVDKAFSFFLVSFAVLLLGVFLCWRFVNSRFGAALQGARMNPVRLSAVGIAPFPVKLTAFVLSAIIVGIAGALFADLNGFVSPTSLSWHTSGELIIFVILGGVGRLVGPLIGAIVFVLLETYLGGMTDRWQLFLGLILLCTVLFANGGIMGLLAGRAKHD
ncbi:MAG: branched-chain amino acid ABC transporter permease [Hyphomicrobiales bacterium]